jgi:hypothetical protein
MNSLDPPEHVFIHHSCFVQDFALRLRAGRSDIKSRYDLGEFEATARMHLHAFIRVVPDAKDAIAGNIETLYSLLVLLCILVALLLLRVRDTYVGGQQTRCLRQSGVCCAE